MLCRCACNCAWKPHPCYTIKYGGKKNRVWFVRVSRLMDASHKTSRDHTSSFLPLRALLPIVFYSRNATPPPLPLPLSVAIAGVSQGISCRPAKLVSCKLQRKLSLLKLHYTLRGSMEGFLEAILVIFKVLELALTCIDCWASGKLGCCYWKLFFL